MLYKKTIENRLFRINTEFGIEKTKEIIVNYFNEEKWDIDYDEENCLIATMPIGLFGATQSTVILIEGTVLLNVMRTGSKSYAKPILIDDIEIKKEIETAIREYGKPKSNKPINEFFE